jgi:hypothetical protein
MHTLGRGGRVDQLWTHGRWVHHHVLRDQLGAFHGRRARAGHPGGDRGRSFRLHRDPAAIREADAAGAGQRQFCYGLDNILLHLMFSPVHARKCIFSFSPAHTLN